MWISQKHKNLDITRAKNIFSSNSKKYDLHIKGYFVAKNSFIAEVTFKFLISVPDSEIIPFTAVFQCKYNILDNNLRIALVYCLF